MSAEQPSFNQLKDQLDAGHRHNMTMLLEGEDGKIITASFAGKKQAEGDLFQVEVTTADGGKEFQYVSSADMSDERQAELAEALGASREASPELGEKLSVEELEELGRDALDASGIDEPKEQDVKSSEFTQFMEAELVHSADLAARTVNELTGASDGNEQYFHDARRNALGVLDQAIRRGMNGEPVTIGGELVDAVEVLQRATSQLELGLDGEVVNRSADAIRTSSHAVDHTASEFFANADPRREEERSGIVSRARTLQVEISSMLHEEVVHYVDKIGRDEQQFGELVSGIRTKLGYMHELNDDSGGLYRDVQELISLADASEQSRYKLRREVTTLNDHIQQLRDLAGTLAHL